MSVPSSAKLTLKHQPFGEQHPYEPLACERRPRRPADHEVVILGVETSRDPSPEAVWCDWQIEGSAGVQRVEAARLTSGGTTETWQAKLPPFSGGETVRYRLYAKSAGEIVESPEYRFGVSRWVRATQVRQAQAGDRRLDLTFATERADLWVRLSLQPEADGSIGLRLTSTQADPGAGEIQPGGNEISAAWEDVSVALLPDALRISAQRASDGLRLETAAPLEILVDVDGTVRQYRLRFDSPAEEAFYGFGERFNALDQRGSHLDNRVYGQYTHQGKRSYIPVPFFLSSRGYGVWLKTDRQAQFDLAAERADAWWFSGEPEEAGAALELELFFQPAPRDIVQAFTQRIGKPQLPPAWTFGLWMSSNDWNSQAEVLRQVRLAEQENIPATVLVIEAWSDEINFYIWNDAQYPIRASDAYLSLSDFTFPKEGRWPDPKAMIDALHEKGIHLILWQNPAIKFAEPREQLDERLNKIDDAYAIQHGFVVTKADGTPHRVEAHMPWFGNSLVLDFDNPQAAEWWFKKRAYLVAELGVDGFKTDGGEHIWDVETVFAKGLRGSRGINRYPNVYQSAYRRFMQAHKGNDHLLFSRAGYTGAQANPAHWAGDENSTWEAFRATLHAMQNVGISGVPFFGWDIAGFAGPLPTSELYLRAAAFSVFCPIMQYHSDVNHQRQPSRDRTPWNMQAQTGDARVVPLFRRFTNLRYNLMPYILAQAEASSQSGLPLVRALPLEFPGDAAARQYPYEYLFGEALLIAPVVEPDRAEWTVYLPQGAWRDFWTGARLEGGQVITVAAPMERIPVYQREGSLLPLNLGDALELCSPVGAALDAWSHLVVSIFPGAPARVAVGQGKDSPAAVFTAERLDPAGSARVAVTHLRQAVDLFILGDEPRQVTLDGTPLPRVDEAAPSTGAFWQWRAEGHAARVHLPGGLEEAALLLLA